MKKNYFTIQTYLAGLLLLILLFFSGCSNGRFKEIKKGPSSLELLIVKQLNSGVKLKNVYITSSKRYPGDFYVAGEIYGEKMSGVITGLWIVNGSVKPSGPLSVNQAAIAFSKFPISDNVKKLAGLSSNTEARRLVTFINGKHYR